MIVNDSIEEGKVWLVARKGLIMVFSRKSFLNFSSLGRTIVKRKPDYNCMTTRQERQDRNKRMVKELNSLWRGFIIWESRPFYEY